MADDGFMRSQCGSTVTGRRTSIVLLLGALAGCGSDPGAPDAAGLDAASSDAPEPSLDTGPGPDAAPPPRLYDPAVFDCRATEIPERASPLPLACPTDRACTGMRLASSHRGAGAPSTIAPENTLSAIRAAIALGADLVEMDVRPTSDEVLVLMHDGDVARTTAGSGSVSAMTLAEVRALPLRTDGFDGDFSCDRVPTFMEALELASGRISIVVDASKTDRVDLIVGAIQAAGALDRVVFDTADTDRIAEALALAPELRFLVRGSTPAELETRLAAVAPAEPVYVHIDLADPALMAPLVHDAGLRVFALGFVADVVASRTGLDAYEPLYGSGVDMVQSNRIDQLGTFLGR